MVQYRAARNIDRVAAAISDPTRRAIMERLARGRASISDVAKPFPMSLTGFCKHVRVLERAGLVRRTRFGRENTLELSAEPLRDVARWVLNYERFWEARLDRLEKFFTADAVSAGLKRGNVGMLKEGGNEIAGPQEPEIVRALIIWSRPFDA